MQELNLSQIEVVSGGMVVSREDCPPGIYIDENGNPWTTSGMPLFSVQ